MDRRRGHLVVTAAALPLALVTTALLAPPAVGHPRPSTGEEVVGTLASLKTRSNKIVLTDGRTFRYDRNDLLLVQHLYDFVEEPHGDEEPTISCDLFDTGGEKSADRLVRKGREVTVRALVFQRHRDVSSFILSADTCDGVVDDADTL